MNKYLLKKKFTSEFFASNFDSAVKSKHPAVSEGDALVDGKFVYSQLEFRYHSTTCDTEWGVFFRKEGDDESWVIDDWG